MYNIFKTFRTSRSLRRNVSITNVTYRHYPSPPKRFYKNVHVSESDGWFEISIDKRKLKTPNSNIFKVRSEALATAVATEWDSQQSLILQHNMHLTALCNTEIDNPCNLTTESITENMLQYLSSDTLCFRSTEPLNFAILQKEKWDPVLNWFENRYNIKIQVCEDISSQPVSSETLEKIRRQLLSYSFSCLLGIQFATENLKSLILSLAVVNHVLDVESAVALARLETTFQMENWGTIEWAHSVDEAQLKSRVSAGILFSYWNQSLPNTNEKVSTSKRARIETQ